jgi:hypothetical protein
MTCSQRRIELTKNWAVSLSIPTLTHPVLAAREVGFGAIDAGAVDAIALLVVDPLNGKAGMQRVQAGLSSA